MVPMPGNYMTSRHKNLRKELRAYESDVAPQMLVVCQRAVDALIRTVRDGDALFIRMAELRRYATTNYPADPEQSAQGGGVAT